MKRNYRKALKRNYRKAIRFLYRIGRRVWQWQFMLQQGYELGITLVYVGGDLNRQFGEINMKQTEKKKHLSQQIIILKSV